MIFDTHMHTNFSSDSEMPIKDVLEVLEQKDIGVILTEHYDEAYPTSDFKCDIENYLKRYEQYRSNRLLLGIEIGMTREVVAFNEKLVKSYPFDFVIASTHRVENWELYDEYGQQNIPERHYYQKYYEYMLEVVKAHQDFDSLGHIDYIYRYSPFEKPEIDLKKDGELIQEVFDAIIDKGKVIELNSRRLDNKDSIEVLRQVYKLYYDQGGRYVTLGSDAHSKQGIGKYFDIAYEMIHSIGLKPVYFKERKIEYLF